ncbi:hypothetical protein L810_8801 [Burkholderia sp. AU4i]|nr:hypothetical protein L810_8801 [Burkholderia sp. AU4i]MDW9247084.1 hypothetical protein [Burkholderia cepacia]
MIERGQEDDDRPMNAMQSTVVMRFDMARCARVPGAARA